MRLSARIQLCVTVAGAVLVLGCGDGTGLAKRYPVSGTVTYNGKPVEKGTITFAPATADGRSAAGTIANGSYTLTTLAPNDGALPGKYKVTIASTDIDTSEIVARAQGGAGRHDAAFVKANKNAKNLVPSKYSLADTSKLEYEVKPQSNTADFPLTD
jgi:hypothetical protein